ncbi:MAG TPA: hypothetical protein ENG48_11135 [Candidatus Atribacteria bacterium]|nr:hypothetical protein [Candidatus Atribacteria bacterium]
MEYIKPCPFCGAEAEFFQRELLGDDYNYSEDNNSWDIRCSNQTCYLSYGADWWLGKEEIIMLWNQRTPYQSLLTNATQAKTEPLTEGELRKALNQMAEKSIHKPLYIDI